MASSPQQPKTTTAATQPNRDLFKGVNYYINDSIRPSVVSQLRQLLDENGATQAPALVIKDRDHLGPRFDPEQVTHLITDTLDLPELELIKPALTNNSKRITTSESRTDSDQLNLVSPYWVTRSYDLQRIQAARFYSPDRNKIFSGMCFCTSDLPRADVAAIAAGVEALGGQWKAELTREVTHLFVVAPEGLKYEMALLHGHAYGMVVLLPHWFEECLKLGQLTPIDLYRFPEPPLTHALRTDDSTKPFQERLSDYWKRHTLLQTGQPTPGRVTATGQLQEAESMPATSATSHLFGAERASAGLASATYQTIVHDEAKSHESSGTLHLPDRDIGGRAVSRLGTATSLASTTVAGGSSRATHGAGGGGHLDAGPCPEPIFQGRRVYLASDLMLRPGLEKALKVRIQDAGGQCWSWIEGVIGGEELNVERHKVGRAATDAFERRRRAERELLRSDIVITRTREGWEYWHAVSSTAGPPPNRERTIGNMAWLYHVLANGKLDSPLDRLLHYPIPSVDGVSEFRDKTITITNYVGAARDYVRTMIECLGAQFEGTMTKQTSYVLTASEYGAKVKHARTWGIPLVSHLWLETCLAEWRFIDPASSARFLSDATSVTNFTSVLGNTRLERESIERWSERSEARALRAEAMRSVDPGLAPAGPGVGARASGLEEVDEEEGGGDLDMGGAGHVDVAAMERLDEEDEAMQVDERDDATPRRKVRAVHLDKDETASPSRQDNDRNVQDARMDGDAGVPDENEWEQEMEAAVGDDESEPVHRGTGRAKPTPVKKSKPTSTTTTTTTNAGGEKEARQHKEPSAAQSSGLSSAESAAVKEQGEDAASSPSSQHEIDHGQQRQQSRPLKRAQADPGTGPDKSAKPSTLKHTNAPSTGKGRIHETPQGKPGSRRRKRRSSSLSSESSSAPDVGRTEKEGHKEEEGEEDDDDDDGSSSPPPPPTSITRTFTLIDQENIIVGGSRRAAAGRATALLAQQMPDAIKFAQELKSSGHKKRRRLSSHPHSSQQQQKRVESVDDDESGDGDEEEEEENDEADEPRAVLRKAAAGRTGRKGVATGGGKRDRVGEWREDEMDQDDGTAADEDDDDDDKDDVPTSRSAAPSKKRQKSKVTTTTTNHKSKAAIATKKGSRLAQVTQGEVTTQEGAVSSFDNPPRGKPPTKPSKRAMIMCTGLNMDSKSSEIKTLKSLGANWTDSPAQVTHLVVKAMLRTEKFLSSLGAAPFVVTRDWVDASIKAGRLVDEAPYLLKDVAKEAELGDTLDNIIERARQRKLFEGLTFYVTKGVKPDKETMQRILQSGNAIVIAGNISKPYQQAILRNRETQFVISCGADRQQWETLASKGVPIYTVEAVLRSVSVQSMAGFENPANRVDPKQHEK